MSKLSVVVAALALVLGGCAGEVEGPEEFAFVTTTDDGDLYLRGTEAADQINAEDPTVLVTVDITIPNDEHAIINLRTGRSGLAYDPEEVSIYATAKTHILTVGSEASVEQIKVGMREWITMFTRRD